MGELVSIGDFARMTFLTVKALRHYHDVGLLEPARVDPHSGYRFYRPEQVATAQLIRRFRDLDLPVDQVRQVLVAADEEARSRVIVAHLERMSRQLHETQETVESLRRMLGGEVTALSVERRSEPELRTIAIRAEVTAEDAMSWLVAALGELHDVLRRDALRRTGPDGALFPTAFFTDGVAELVAFVPVAGEVSGRGRMGEYGVPAAELASTTYDGPMVDLDQAYGAVGHQVLEQALASDGPVRERYLPLGDEDDLLHHRTEVSWPVRDAR